jgi:hypothetical protein
MSDDLSFLEPVTAILLDVIAPLRAALADATTFEQLLLAHGWKVAPGSLTAAEIQQAFGLEQAIAAIAADVTQLDQDGAATDQASVYASLVPAVGNLIYQLGMLISNPPQALPFPFDQADFWTEFPAELVDELFISYLRGHSPAIFASLYGTGLIDEQLRQAGSTAGRADYTVRSIQWQRIPEIISPAKLLRDVYGWGSASLDWQKLLARLGLILDNLGLLSQQVPADPAEAGPYWAGAPPATLQCLRLTIAAGQISDTASYALGLVILPIPGSGGAADGLAIYPEVVSSLPALTFGETSIDVSGQFAISGGISLELRPGASSVTTTAVSGTLNEHLGASIAPSSPLIFFGTVNGTHLSAQSLSFGLSVQGAPTAPDIDLNLRAENMELIISAGDFDGFLASMLGSSDTKINFSFSLGWSSQRGVHLGDGASAEVTIPLNIKVLIAEIDSLTIGVAASGSGLVLNLGATGMVILGPLTGTIQNLGLAARIVPAPQGSAGTLGQYDLSFGFKPPDGVALALSAPPVTGVGYLDFDEADGRYLGALALAVGDVAISAVGVLDTKLPGGATGYSLIVVASAQFPPIQLGFGFSLSGLGGLVGVNRTADVPSLQALARAGRIDDLMFPADLIHRAPQVAANLAQEFPVAPGHFIVGPAAQIQWGTGGLVYADLGVFIELTDSGGGITVLRIALLGLVHLTLPDGAAPVADITLDVLGVLDFAAKTLSLDAGLRNSTIATFPLTGQAALRAGWGASPEFLFAVGGFNPAFQAPAGFPDLQRIALSIGGDNPRLRLSAYLALTSNTLQLGCAADLYASDNEAGVTAAVAASLTFDALVQFKPFGLIVDLTISAAILVNNNPILAMNLDLHVTGPDPWTVSGSASFQFLLATITVPISISGQAAVPQPAPRADLDASLLTALADPRSWATGPPAGRSLVRVRSQGAADIAVHPLGSLTVRQHAVPLGQRLECYGPDLLDAPCQYDITGADLGTQPVNATAVSDYFAPAQFRTMTDQQKLSSPSFENMTAGATLGSAGLSLAPVPVPGQAIPPVADSVPNLVWDQLVLDSPDPAPAGSAQPTPARPQPSIIATTGTTSVPDQLLTAQLGGAAAALSGPAGQPEAIYASPGIGIGVQDPYYAITGLDLGVPASNNLTSLTAGLTAAAQAGYKQNWQIVYTSEVR